MTLWIILLALLTTTNPSQNVPAPGIYRRDKQHAIKIALGDAHAQVRVWNRGKERSVEDVVWDHDDLISFKVQLSVNGKNKKLAFRVATNTSLQEVKSKAMWINSQVVQESKTGALFRRVEPCGLVAVDNFFRSVDTGEVSPPRRSLRRENEEACAKKLAALPSTKNKPKIFILLTMTVDVHIHVNYSLAGQQRDPVDRRRMYEDVAAFYAHNSSCSVVVVENSGADLRSLEARVPASRRASFEFLSVAPRNKHDIGSLEASAILDALAASVLLRNRSDSDLVVKVTGRYRVLDLVQKLEAQCFGSGSSHPSLVINRPSYNLNRQETTLIGFTRLTERALLGWAEGGACFECLATELVPLLRAFDPKSLCVLHKMPVIPAQEGSTSIWRDHV